MKSKEQEKIMDEWKKTQIYKNENSFYKDINAVLLKHKNKVTVRIMSGILETFVFQMRLQAEASTAMEETGMLEHIKALTKPYQKSESPDRAVG